MSNILASSSITIVDLNDGLNSYTILLTNENLSIACNELGVPKTNEIGSVSCKAKTKILVKKGKNELSSIGESQTVSEGFFKYIIKANPTCTATRINNDELYINTISEDSGQLDIEIIVDDDSIKFTKTLTWNKVYDGIENRYVNLIGPSFFNYDNKEDTTPMPAEINIEALIVGIKNYTIKWYSKNNIEPDWVLIANSPGSTINGNILTINDTLLFKTTKMIDVKVDVVDTNFNKSYSFVKTITKVYGGNDSPYIKLSGERIFKYIASDHNTSVPSVITLSVETYNIPSPTFVWQHFTTSWQTITSQSGSLISGNNLTINDKLLFGSKDSITIRCYTNQLGASFNDTITITKIYDGKVSKTVKISGSNVIYYDNNSVPAVDFITITATPKNYINPKYVWKKYSGSNYVPLDIGTIAINKVTFPVGSLNDANLIKVECSENNDSDLSYDEYTITKVYSGSVGSSYSIAILNGTRSLAYNGNSSLLTTNILPFTLEVYKDNVNIIGTPEITNITWDSTGHFSNPTNIGGNSFTPVPLNTYNIDKLNTTISVIVNCKGIILKDTVSISVSKNFAALSWVEDWDNSKVSIGEQFIISPKLFAGKKNTQTNEITGIAIGQDIINNNSNIGMAIYNKNTLIGKINADPSLDNNIIMSLGNVVGKRFLLKDTGEVFIEGGLTVTATNSIIDLNGIIDNSNNTLNKINDIFSDSRITPNEKQLLKKDIDIINGEKSKLNNIATSFCITTENVNYNNAYTTLNNSLANILLDLTITSTCDLNSIRTNFINYYDAKQDLMNAINNKNKGLADEAKSSISVVAGQISSKVEKNGVISAINQTAEAITIEANKINLSGVTTFVKPSDLGANGTTVIDGNRISTGTISVNKLIANNEDPIINLFDNCSLDATLNMNKGRGSAIRLKWDNENYIMVKKGQTEIYINSLTYNKSALYSFTEAGLKSIPDDLWLGKISKLDATGAAIRIWAVPHENAPEGQDTGIRANGNGVIELVCKGIQKHRFYDTGAKDGGSIEVGGVNFGMSPIDSPQTLLEDVLFDINVVESGTVLNLDITFKETITTYAVFPSNGKCEIVEKTKDNFKVIGFTGVCSFRIIGKRKGYENKYYSIMGGEGY